MVKNSNEINENLRPSCCYAITAHRSKAGFCRIDISRLLSGKRATAPTTSVPTMALTDLVGGPCRFARAAIGASIPDVGNTAIALSASAMLHSTRAFRLCLLFVHGHRA
jgi:hypothetical protein